MNKDYYKIAESYYDQEDYKTAFDYYQKGAELGNAKCINALGYCYEHGDGVERNEEKSFEYYKQAANLNDLKAMRNLGSIYNDGSSYVPANQELAFYWYKQAASIGDAECQSIIGIRYLKGLGTEINEQEAIEWLTKAANQHYFAAAHKLANIYDGKNNQKEADKWYKKCAELGKKESQNEYGLRLAREKNYEEAVYWYQQAADQGYPEAMANLGYCYLYGNGVKKDKKKARYYILNCKMPFLLIPDELYKDDEDE